MQSKSYKRVLTIAGSDSGGGAGIQADIKTISALGCYASSAITCITAQNTLGVQAVEPLSIEIIRQQINSVLNDVGADAIKIGMLGSPEIAECVATILRNFDGPIVLDPVLVATSGDVLTRSDTIDVIVKQLMPLAVVTTPNLEECVQLSGYVDARAWTVLNKLGAKSLLVKGGHGHEDILIDTLYSPSGVFNFKNERITTDNTHGTGCTLSSAIAAYLAHGLPLGDAVDLAIRYVHKAIGRGAEYKLGDGHGPVFHFYKYW